MTISNVNLFFRNLWQNKLYTGITVFGFAFSLTFVILLGAYIRQELAVDQFHKNKDRIFRAVHEKQSSFGTLIGSELQDKYPEIECYTRLHENASFVENLQHEKVSFNFLMVDSTFFRMFSFRLLEGEPSEVLRERNSVVLTRSYARKLFGEEEAVGKEITCKGHFKLMVTGIMEDMPENTHFNPCDGLLPFPFLADFWDYPTLFQNNGNSSFGLYFMAKAGTDLRAKAPFVLKDFQENYWMYKQGYKKEFAFEPLTETYFSGKGGQGIHGNNKMLVTMLVAIALVILLLALINYNNLSVAQAGFRAKEAAVKKLLGTDNRHLFWQFILESEALCFISFGLAMGLSLVFQPVFNQLLDTHVSIAEQITGEVAGMALFGVAVLGLIAGVTPAYLITRFNPIDVVKGAFRKKTKGVYSKALISFQYTIAIGLIVCTIVIWRQTNFLRNYNLGFDKENVIYIENSGVMGSQKMALRSEFAKIPGVVGVSFVCGSPVDGGNNSSFTYKERSLSFQVFKIDTAFFRLMEIQVERNDVAESERGIWLNQAGVKALELEKDPKECNLYGEGSIPILGVVPDFHFRDLTYKVGPALFLPLQEKEWPWCVLVKVDSPHLSEIFKQVIGTYGRFVEGNPFEAEFMDQTINQWYESNERTGRLIGYFSVLAIILSVMGILAMATYFIQQRVKEIGIRRVNGATVSEILHMLVESFMKWILLAFVLACPLAWYAVSHWLDGFAYRIDLNWWIFGIAGGFSAFIALIIVGWQSIKAARVNPVRSLKNE